MLKSLATFFHFFFHILLDCCLSVNEYFKTQKKPSETPKLFYNKTEFNEKIVSRLPSAKFFTPLWWAAHAFAQTLLLEFFFATISILKTSPTFREFVTTDDSQTLVLDWINFDAEQKTVKAILCLFPGLCGTSDACYLRPWHTLCHKMGYMGVVITRRGFLREHPLNSKTVRYPTYMDAEDMKIAMDAVQKRFPDIPKFGVGYSAGGNHLIGYAAKDSSVLNGCITVACGMHINKCMWFMGDTPLGRLFATGPKQIKDMNIHLPFYQNIQQDNNLAEIDSHYAKVGGHKSLDDYYMSCSTHELITKLQIPTLCVMSADDPLLQFGHKEDHISFANSNDNVISVITERGGHCAWIQNDLSSWAAQLVVDYVEAALEISRK